MLSGDFEKDLESYIKENKGRKRASKRSQIDLYKVSKSFGGILNPGKMYIFNYYTPDEAEYDTNPIVIGLGRSDDGNQLGLNLHYIPYRVRVQLIQRIYTSFDSFIKQQIKGRGLGNPTLQQPITQLNWDNLKASYGNFFNLNYAVRQYRVDRMKKPLVIGFENWYLGAVNDENMFYGTTILEAQSKFF